MSSPLLTVDEVAALLRVHRSTIKRMLSRGTLKPVKVERRTFIHREQVEAICGSADLGGPRSTGMPPEELRKARAHASVHQATTNGTLVRATVCESCGRDDIALHGHHDDYDRPLEVRWLCPGCHLRHHYQEPVRTELESLLESGRSRRTMAWFEDAA